MKAGTNNRERKEEKKKEKEKNHTTTAGPRSTRQTLAVIAPWGVLTGGNSRVASVCSQGALINICRHKINERK